MQSLPAAVNAPIFDSQGQGRFIQPVYLDTYSTDLCAAACDKQTQWDKSQSADACNYKTCVYANLYMLNKDGALQTVVCALYTEMTDPSAAVNNCKLMIQILLCFLTHQLQSGLFLRIGLLSSLQLGRSCQHQLSPGRLPYVL